MIDLGVCFFSHLHPSRNSAYYDFHVNHYIKIQSNPESISWPKSVHSCSSWSSNCIGFCFHFSTWLCQANAPVTLPVAYSTWLSHPAQWLTDEFWFQSSRHSCFCLLWLLFICDCCVFLGLSGRYLITLLRYFTHLNSNCSMAQLWRNPKGFVTGKIGSSFGILSLT